ncbi:hypothetical protein O181_075899 [Austropuccinia psidii MF-1]|uniref:Uncharacterized protein n=1 Tax=Austropuccinia psidii MF-1 TaxID=1389203 RepID=A0A9Q3IEX0_9BASI|nr:hypothetical protein [Austropuccinia psidii MF-1]
MTDDVMVNSHSLFKSTLHSQCHNQRLYDLSFTGQRYSPADRLRHEVCKHRTCWNISDLYLLLSDYLSNEVELNFDMLHPPIVAVTIAVFRVDTSLIITKNINRTLDLATIKRDNEASDRTPGLTTIPPVSIAVGLNSFHFFKGVHKTLMRCAL